MLDFVPILSLGTVVRCVRQKWTGTVPVQKLESERTQELRQDHSSEASQAAMLDEIGL